MASVASESASYPTSDGRPMAETDLLRDLMVALIKTLQARYAADRMVYISGNLLLFYVPGNKRKHVAPDVFVVLGVAKRQRDNYLVWEEGKGPDFVLELTSSSTRREDTAKKFELYRDVLKVREYFLFNPKGDYLKPQLQGYRLDEGEYVPVEPVQGRLPSDVVGLHLEQYGSDLKLYDPATRQWLLAPEEKFAEETLARQRAEAEVERLRRELEALRRGQGQQSSSG
jgi:Uma2 family endonuclease